MNISATRTNLSFRGNAAPLHPRDIVGGIVTFDKQKRDEFNNYYGNNSNHKGLNPNKEYLVCFAKKNISQSSYIDYNFEPDVITTEVQLQDLQTKEYFIGILCILNPK